MQYIRKVLKLSVELIISIWLMITFAICGAVDNNMSIDLAVTYFFYITLGLAIITLIIVAIDKKIKEKGGKL